MKHIEFRQLDPNHLIPIEEFFYDAYCHKYSPPLYPDNLPPSMQELSEAYPREAEEFCRLFNQWLGPFVPESNLVRPNMDIYVFHRLRYRRVPPHSHQFFEIILVREGSCENIVHERKRYTLNKGELCFMPPQVQHDTRINDAHSIVQSIAIRTTTFEKAFQSIYESNDIISMFFQHALHQSNGNSPILFCRTKNEDQIFNLVDRMVEEQNRYDMFSSISINSIFLLFIVELLRLHKLDFTTSESVLKTDDVQIVRILKFIQDNYKSITLKDVADEFHYGESYLSHKIRQCTGKNFTEIIRTLKLQEAVTLLSEGEKISAVVNKVGYNDYSHFFRIFKSQYGMSPTQYRDSHSGFTPFHEPCIDFVQKNST